MPPKDMNEHKIGIMTDGEFYEMKPITPCTLGNIDDDMIDISPLYDCRIWEKGHEFSIDLNCNELTSNDLWLVLSGICTLTQINQNNWRRMHGLPMKSRRKRRK